jgi:protein-S-isoprenylcysteine O-methyltransferase Ste14
MVSWRILTVATGLQLLISFLPCIVWSWHLAQENERQSKLPSLLCLAAILVLSLWCEVIAIGGRDDVRGRHQSKALTGAWLTGFMLLGSIWLGLFELTYYGTRYLELSVPVGAIIACIGIGLRVRAILELGPDFKTEHGITSPARLRTAGIYGWMRHPSETGLILLAAGVALLLESILAALVVTLGLCPLVVYRLRDEEAVLHEQCGAAYDHYSRKTPLLFPWRIRIWR